MTRRIGCNNVSAGPDDIGAFETPALRNAAVAASFTHDGSLKTLREVVENYDNGGATKPDDPVNDFLSGGIRPLALTEQQVADLVAFMGSLTRPRYTAE